jgi:hypothetical protein
MMLLFAWVWPRIVLDIWLSAFTVPERERVIPAHQFPESETT